MDISNENRVFPISTLFYGSQNISAVNFHPSRFSNIGSAWHAWGDGDLALSSASADPDPGNHGEHDKSAEQQLDRSRPIGARRGGAPGLSRGQRLLQRQHPRRQCYRSILLWRVGAGPAQPLPARQLLLRRRLHGAEKFQNGCALDEVLLMLIHFLLLVDLNIKLKPSF